MTSSRVAASRLLAPGTPDWDKSMVAAIQSCNASRTKVTYEKWKIGDPEGPDMTVLGRGQVDRATAAKWKVAVEVHQPDVYGWPPKNTRLSDGWLVLAIIYLNVKERATRWPADFELNGNVRKTRVPVGRPVVAEVNGQRWTVVFKGYYAMIGEREAEKNSWLVNVYPGGGPSNRLQIGAIRALDDGPGRQTPIQYGTLPCVQAQRPPLDFTPFEQFVRSMPGTTSVAELGRHEGKELRWVKDRQRAIKELAGQTQTSNVDLTSTTPTESGSVKSQTPSPLEKLKRFNDLVWKETKNTFGVLKSKRDTEVLELKKKLEEANKELLAKQHRIDTLEEALGGLDYPFE
ncbi:hypothetical protein ABOM_010506 [Aspergillus bombycis]|uniref:Uncharacterized protein n=1 Tax=Aspergillus bombycis TaxID=109264 RepID=A0A1F7ZNV3_9EURO|nr:hypothetical protein ABOM_010506 [Aspergillus bombycis]OGM40969.1 hypothetical protein ABOM_010506 [Aspergillus bombycis]